jgi:hypothetical protein
VLGVMTVVAAVLGGFVYGRRRVPASQPGATVGPPGVTVDPPEVTEGMEQQSVAQGQKSELPAFCVREGNQ